MSKVLLDMNYHLAAKRNGVTVPNFFENIHTMLDNMAIKKGIDLETYSANRGSKGMTSIDHDFESLNKSWEQKMSSMGQVTNSQNVMLTMDSVDSQQISKVHY